LKAKAEERKEVASFTEFYKEQLSKEKKTLAYITYSGHRNTLAVLTEYRGNVPFEELNYELIEGFNNFLLSRKLKLNSVEKYHRHLRKYINIAIKKDLFEYRKNPYRLFKIKGEKTTRTALSPTELDRLAALVFSSEEKHLEPIRDMFLLSCYTGLRYSDVVQIRHTHLSEESAGQLLELKAVKTQKQLQLPLFDLFRNPDGKSKPEMIIEKYYRPDGLPFFKGITNQYANRCLKTIVLLARIRKKVSFHTARHTFGTTMASKVPIPVLRELMQHDKLETTQIYLHISNQMIRSQLQNVKW
jgi:site-specific recombinase XerD